MLVDMFGVAILARTKVKQASKRRDETKMVSERLMETERKARASLDELCCIKTDGF